MFLGLGFLLLLFVSGGGIGAAVLIAFVNAILPVVLRVLTLVVGRSTTMCLRHCFKRSCILDNHSMYTRLKVPADACDTNVCHCVVQVMRPAR